MSTPSDWRPTLSNLDRSALDRAGIEHKLVTLRRSLVQLEHLGPVTRERMAEHHSLGLVVERVLFMLDDLARGINSHVAVWVLGEKPQTFSASFAAAARAGLIDEEVAAEVGGDDPHHVLLQLSLDAEPAEVAGIVERARAGYGRYAEQVARWTAEHAAQG